MCVCECLRDRDQCKRDERERVNRSERRKGERGLKYIYINERGI